MMSPARFTIKALPERARLKAKLKNCWENVNLRRGRALAAAAQSEVAIVTSDCGRPSCQTN
jgi:hypothetical protein